MTPEKLKKIESSNDLKSLIKFMKKNRQKPEKMESFFRNLLENVNEEMIKKVIKKSDKTNLYSFLCQVIELGKKELALFVINKGQIRGLEGLAVLAIVLGKNDLFIELVKREPSMVDGQLGKQLLDLPTLHDSEKSKDYIKETRRKIKETKIKKSITKRIDDRISYTLQNDEPRNGILKLPITRRLIEMMGQSKTRE